MFFDSAFLDRRSASVSLEVETRLMTHGPFLLFLAAAPFLIGGDLCSIVDGVTEESGVIATDDRRGAIATLVSSSVVPAAGGGSVSSICSVSAIVCCVVFVEEGCVSLAANMESVVNRVLISLVSS